MDGKHETRWLAGIVGAFLFVDVALVVARTTVSGRISGGLAT